jgi:hypothetical protein
MRTYYRLLFLNVAVVTSIMMALHFHILKHSPFFLFVFPALLVANYAITRQLARQRGTSILEIGLWLSWVAGPVTAAILPPCMVIFILEPATRDSFINSWVFCMYAISALTTVRKAEEDGWVKIDPNGPKSFSEALRN